MGSEASVAGIAGEQRLVAEVLLPVSAITAVSAGVAKPGYPDTPAKPVPGNTLTDRLDATHDFMSRNERQLRTGQVTVDHMEIGATDGTGLAPDENLACSRQRVLPFQKHQRLPNFVQHHRAHNAVLPTRSDYSTMKNDNVDMARGR